MKTLCVKQLDDGTFAVGELPPEIADAGYEGEMKPAASLDEALDMVRQDMAPMGDEQAMGDQAEGERAAAMAMGEEAAGMAEGYKEAR